jgi:CheY-like chemotaxis protein
MSGAELAGALRCIRPDIPIILCTGFSHTVTAETARELGMNAFLMKPLVSRDLAQAIRRVLEPQSTAV